MLGRWFFLAVVGIGLVVIVHGQRSTASTGAVVLACDHMPNDAAPANIRATVQWQAPDRAPDQVWFDLGISRDFIDGSWSGNGPLAPDPSSFTTDVLAPGVHYYYRVTALRSGKWRVIADGSFDAHCPDA